MNWVQINIQVNEDFRYMKIHIFALRWRAVGLLAQLVERCTGIAEVMGSNPVQAWIFFFRSYFHYCSSSVHFCEDRFHIQRIPSH